MAIAILILLFFLEPILCRDDLCYWENYRRINLIKAMRKSEINFRRKVYMENLAKIQEHNDKFRKGLVSYSLEMNNFGHLTEKEFINMYANSYLYDENKKWFGRNNNYYYAPKGVTLPKFVDWRLKGVVTPIKSQRGCASCYAFATVASIESQYAIKHNELLEFSEQQIIDCARNSGCKGGYLHHTYDYALRTGLTLRTAYPYEAQRDTCRLKENKIVVKLKQYKRVHPNSIYNIQAAVALQGPVTAGVNATSWQFLSAKEILTDKWCVSKSPISHFVSVVGYNVTKEGSHYWIIKNSWGEKWGNQGYINVEYNKDDVCGVRQLAMIPYLDK